MTVLLLQLAGPMQSWGDSARFVRRETRTEPTKSAVIGLLASAQGRTREDPIEDLLGLRFGVRVEQRGRIMQDFQTEKSLSRKRNSRDFEKVMPLTYRYYLSDARFLVALEAEKTVLDGLDQALRKPRWPLYLGRRSCPPEFPVTLGVHDEYADVREALEREPWHASAWYKRRYPDQQLEIVCDAEDGESFLTQADMPVTFSQRDRRYAGRAVHRYRIDNPGIGSPATGRDAGENDEPPTFAATGDADPMSFA